MARIVDQLVSDYPHLLWRGFYQRPEGQAGQNELQALLDGAWPPGLIEISYPGVGIGEWSILAPWIKRLTTLDRHVALLNPPCQLYTPSLLQQGIHPDRLLTIHANPHDTLWAAGRLLNNSLCGTVLLWANQLGFQASRKLSMTAKENQGRIFHYHDLSKSRQTGQSTTRIKLMLSVQGSGLSVTLIKPTRPGPPTCMFYRKLTHE